MSYAYENIGASEMYTDLITREDWKLMEKSDHPAVSSRQCYFCKRGVQPTEEVVRDGDNVAHAACVRFLIGLINAGRPKEPKEFVPEPNMEAVRQDVAESERRTEETRKALARANSTKTILMYK